MPIPQAHLQTGIDLWSHYISGNDRDPLVQLAITHAEFEALHPFKDGNGRLGRMIIPLFLFERGVLSGPNFYMSGYLEARRDEYVERLRAVSRDGAWTEWCAFFLKGLIEQASENQRKAKEILELHQSMSRHVAELTHSQFSGRAVDFLFGRPVFSSTHFVEGSGIPRQTALRIISLLKDARILRTVREGAGSRPSILAFSDLVNVAEGRAVF